MRVLVTGANGFVGRALRQLLLSKSEHSIRCAYRVIPSHVNPVISSHEVAIGCISGSTNWAQCLSGIDVVVHTAAIVHAQGRRFKEILPHLTCVNVDATLALARQSAGTGVRRFIFLSTVKVHGEKTMPGQPFNPDWVPAPTDPYAVSKFEAEQGLIEVARETGMDVVIIRPVLVYGVGVKANFYSMMGWLNRDIPLPLGAINNKRSFVALDNLVDLISICIDHPAAANQIFLVSDGEDLSTTELLQRMGQALGKPARLFSVPTFILKACAAMFGKRDMAQRLCDSLQVDISKTTKLLDWAPPVSVDHALAKTAVLFLHH